MDSGANGWLVGFLTRWGGSVLFLDGWIIGLLVGFGFDGLVVM